MNALSSITRIPAPAPRHQARVTLPVELPRMESQTSPEDASTMLKQKKPRMLLTSFWVRLQLIQYLHKYCLILVLPIRLLRSPL